MSDGANGGKRPEPSNTPALDDEVLPRLSEEHRHNSTDLERDPEKLDNQELFSQEDATEPDGGAISRASSARSRPRVVIPRSKQRGLFARFTVIPELEDPYTYANRTKWCITAVVAVAGGVGPLGSGIFYPALDQMAQEFNTRPVTINLTVALYMLAMGIFPLWWSSFSESFGRRNIYLTSFSLFVLFATLSAVSRSVPMLVVMRFLTGGSSASVQAVGAGTIADIWEIRERGRAMSIFYLGPLMGPLVGPILGGILSQAFGWQATMWALVIYGGVLFVFLVFCLPETLARRTPAPSTTTQAAGGPPGLTRTKTTESVKKHTKKAASFFKQFFVDPLSVLLYLRFPPVLLTVFYAAITFGTLFAVNISLQSAYSSAPYNYSQLIVGLLYIPSSLGYIVTSLFGGKWLDRIMVRAAEKAGRYDENGKLVLLPEDRMRENAWIAGTVYPASLLLYGWTIQYGTFWVVPLIGTFFFGVASMMVFAAATTMLTEFMPKRSSGGVAVNNLVRNILSCLGTIAAQPAITAIGHGWLLTILSLFTWISGYICIYVLRKKSSEWRVSMDKALNG
ncbi:multidrug transporter of the major facilitator superfamily [Plectosphaerella plurivora]|uniref:Multidrug transporter of the major facilitator superfamily n=1 Tax=Plectosphaerella plurivora TaxID=936078 RepID=A0A9P9ACH1_9PEZI|nr:multidrug transporter of the major facilitator superfamily [Plectosphaerella plurivora]